MFKRILPTVFLLGLIGISIPLLFSPQRILSAINHVVISEIQIAGINGVNEDFIELYNPMDTDYDLNGHRLVKRTASGTTDSPIKAWTSETIIPAYGYYLWANNSWTTNVIPDASTSATLAINNSIALRQGAANTGTIIDSVAWGNTTNLFVETNPFPTNPTAGNSIERKSQENSTSNSMASGGSDETNGNGYDSDNNSFDFVAQTVPNPQNSNSLVEPVIIPTATPSPSPTEEPTPTSTIEPTPTVEPTATPTPEPTVTSTPEPQPTAEPTKIPEPTLEPTSTPQPTVEPTLTIEPTAIPTVEPTVEPTSTPSLEPTVTPTEEPSPNPSPTEEPTMTPTPTAEPTPTSWIERLRAPNLRLAKILGYQIVCSVRFTPWKFLLRTVYMPEFHCERIQL